MYEFFIMYHRTIVSMLNQHMVIEILAIYIKPTMRSDKIINLCNIIIFGGSNFDIC